MSHFAYGAEIMNLAAVFPLDSAIANCSRPLFTQKVFALILYSKLSFLYRLV